MLAYWQIKRSIKSDQQISYQNRPWLAVSYKDHAVYYRPESVTISLTVAVQNVGKSPALDVQLSFDEEMDDIFSEYRTTGQYEFEKHSKTISSCANAGSKVLKLALVPGQDSSLAYVAHFPKEDIPRARTFSFRVLYGMHSSEMRAVIAGRCTLTILTSKDDISVKPDEWHAFTVDYAD